VLAQSAYDKARGTPTISLIYEPIDDVSTYFSYIQSLQEGAVVLLLVKSTLSVLEKLIERLDTIPGDALRYLCAFFYCGLADRLEGERIT
jgi:hypothetical protein